MYAYVRVCACAHERAHLSAIHASESRTPQPSESQMTHPAPAPAPVSRIWRGSCAEASSARQGSRAQTLSATAPASTLHPGLALVHSCTYSRMREKVDVAQRQGFDPEMRLNSTLFFDQLFSFAISGGQPLFIVKANTLDTTFNIF